MLPNDPFDDLQDRLRDVWRALHPVEAAGRPGDLEIIEETDVLILTAEMFEVERQDIRVDVSPSKVVIQTPGSQSPVGPRHPAMPVARAVHLPAEVKPEEAEAHYNNGILEVVLPKRIAGGIGVHRIPAEG